MNRERLRPEGAAYGLYGLFGAAAAGNDEVRPLFIAAEDRPGKETPQPRNMPHDLTRGIRREMRRHAQALGHGSDVRLAYGPDGEWYQRTIPAVLHLTTILPE